MKKYRTKSSCTFLLLIVSLMLLIGCDKMTLPRLTHDEQPVGHSPVAVNLLLEEPVRNATLEYQACDQAWQGHLGHAIATAFLDKGKQAFGEVHLVESNSPGDSSNTQSANLTVQLRLVDSSFGSGSQVGSENNTYAATLDIQLLALYLDVNGTAIGQTPLAYREAINVWTPVIDSTGTCSTAQLDAEIEKAANTLARQMVSVVTKATAPPPGSPGGPTIATGSVPSPTVPPGSLSFQATLIDGNDNVILEAGEKVGVRLDVTNSGSTPVSGAQVSLSGTSAIIDAFSTTLAAPVEIGLIQPGATKSTLIWGKMPTSLEAQRGELVVTVISGSTSTQQTLVSAIRPGKSSNSARSLQSHQPARVVQNSTSPQQSSTIDINRYGILIGVDRYLPIWPGVAPRPLAGIIQAASTLKQFGGIPGKQILVLKGNQATKTNMERAVIQWLPSHINQESLVFLYVSGNAVANATNGEVFLVPFTESPTSPEDKFFSLHALQGTLKRARAKMILLFIDTPIISLSENGISSQGKPVTPDWQGMLEPARAEGSIPVIQIVRNNSSSSNRSHPMNGLNGSADLNRDGQVTIGEFLDSMGSTATVYPPIAKNAAERNISLTRN